MNNEEKAIKEFRGNIALLEEVGDKELRDKYEELIMAVSKKFPEETRHQTALRYIVEHENSSNESCGKQDI